MRIMLYTILGTALGIMGMPATGYKFWVILAIVVAVDITANCRDK